MMGFQEAVVDSNRGHGNVLERLEKELQRGCNYVPSPVESLSEQRDVFENNLFFFLNNLTKSKGARKVIEDFYSKEYGRDIDSSDPDLLRKEIPDLDSILHGNTLPVFTKEELREHYGVEGAWGGIINHSKPHLAPDWVVTHENEPYTVNKTSGTTGTPWERAMTRNDVALCMASLARFILRKLDELNAHPSDVTCINPFPESASRPFISRTFELIGTNVETIEYEKLKSGGDTERRVVDNILDFAKTAEYSFVVFPIKEMLEGAWGIELRRGNVEFDVIVNGGAPFSRDQKNIVESTGAQVIDIYGETEYPEYAEKREISGEVGYDLPFNTQINLVYDEQTGELSYEGEGRFAYLPFGIEGQAVPGVYLSGVSCEISRIGDEHQILTKVERVSGTDDCSAIN